VTAFAGEPEIVGALLFGAAGIAGTTGAGVDGDVVVAGIVGDGSVGVDAVGVGAIGVEVAGVEFVDAVLTLASMPRGSAVETPEELQALKHAAIKHDKPVLISVRCIAMVLLFLFSPNSSAV
jgi:hypothetical protein